MNSSIFLPEYAPEEMDHDFITGVAIYDNFRLELVLRIFLEQKWSMVHAFQTESAKSLHSQSYSRIYRFPESSYSTWAWLTFAGYYFRQDMCTWCWWNTFQTGQSRTKKQGKKECSFSSNISSEWPETRLTGSSNRRHQQLFSKNHAQCFTLHCWKGRSSSLSLQAVLVVNHELCSW